jgi:polysaccharide export outer membrane protein
MKKGIFWFVAVVSILSSCVPNKKYVYLQKDDLKTEVITDSVVRSYTLKIDEYRIQPQDILYIRIESLTDEEFDFMSKLYPEQAQGGGGGGGAANPVMRGFLVDEKGEIEFPVVGKVNFAGQTVFEAQEMLQEKFKNFLKDPVARVRLMNFRFTILGEVNREGQVVSNNTRVTLMEAIGMAGGLGELADRSKVKIVRQVGDRADVFYVNLLEEEVLEKEHFYVMQNDIIMVPALKQRPFRIYWSENLSIVVSTLTLVLLIFSLSQN